MDLNPLNWFAKPPAEPEASATFDRLVQELAAPTAPAGAQDALQIKPANPQQGTILQHIGPNNAGVRVTHDRAMMVAAIWACIDVISAALSASNWNVYGGVRDSAQNKTMLENDGLHYVLNTRFNPEMTAQSGKRALGIAAVGYGNGYAEIEYDMAGRIVALWPISPDRVELRRDWGTGRLFYRVTQDMMGGFVDMDPSDIYHVRGASLTGLSGDDVVAKAIQSIAMAIALDQFGASYFANGAHLGGTLSYTGTLDDPAFDRLNKQFNEKHKGARNANKTGILEAGMTYTPFDSDAEKSQMVDSKYQSIEEICRWFRVPPHKIAHLLRATNNNIEHQGLEFSRDTIRPWKIEIEQEADYKLIPTRGPRKFIEIDTDWMAEGDYKSRMEGYQIGRGMGVFSANDVLRKLGENTIGEEGDIRIVNGASIPLDKVGENYRNTGTATVPIAPDDPATEEPAADDAAMAGWLASIYDRGKRRADNRSEGKGPTARGVIYDETLAYIVAEAATLIELLPPVAGGVPTAEWIEEFGSAVLNGKESKTCARAALDQIIKGEQNGRTS